MILANDTRPFSKKKQRVCDFFLKYGNCRQQEACRFLHLRLEDVVQQNALQIVAPEHHNHSFGDLPQGQSALHSFEVQHNHNSLGSNVGGSDFQPLPDLIRCDDDEAAQLSQNQPFRHQLLESPGEQALGLAGQRLPFSSTENGSPTFNMESRGTRGDGFKRYASREAPKLNYESAFHAIPRPLSYFPSSQFPLPDTFTDSDFRNSSVKEFSALCGRSATLQHDDALSSIPLWAEEPRAQRNMQARSATMPKPSYIPGVARAMDGSMWLVSPDGWAVLSEASNSSTMNVGRRRLCDFFCKHGNCRHGLTCSFLHVTESMPVEDYIEARTRKMDLSKFQ
mmetsp:Transcript_26568/g.87262  ORF Transcript_26568/g.87262 Transcript_26568/m.87262 type:complete len:338 (-) Transcript_26568:157-1170(-)